MLVSAVQQHGSAICIRIFPLSCTSLPPFHSTHLCHHRALSWALCAVQQLPTSHLYYTLVFSSVQLLSHVWLFATPWTAACQASLPITNSQSLLKLLSIESVMPSNHLILCHPLLPPSVFPSIRVFSNESVHIRWPKYWSFSFSISPSNEYSALISFRIDWFELLAVQETEQSSPTPQLKSCKVWPPPKKMPSELGNT